MKKLIIQSIIISIFWENMAMASQLNQVEKDFQENAIIKNDVNYFNDSFSDSDFNIKPVLEKNDINNFLDENINFIDQEDYNFNIIQ